jgi:hypothetical protein
MLITTVSEDHAVSKLPAKINWQAQLLTDYWLNLWSWRWRRYVPPKCRWTCRRTTGLSIPEDSILSSYCCKRYEDKAVPVTGRGGPQGCKTPSLPHFLGNRLTHGGPLPIGSFLVLISVRGCFYPRHIVRLEGLGQLKKSTSSGFEATTFRLVA